MNALRRRRKTRQTVVPSFLSEHKDIKQKQRDRTAEEMAKHLGKQPCIFVLPSYDAFCAKTIDKLIPEASFFGVDRYNIIVDNVAELEGGKRIVMERGTVLKFIENHRGSLTFDGAFLDYVGFLTNDRENEIAAFVTGLAAKKFILAVTLQGIDVNEIAQAIQQRLQTVVDTVSVLYKEAYQTKTEMVHMIFLLEKA